MIVQVASDLKVKWQKNHHRGTKVIVSRYFGSVTPTIEDLNNLVACMEATDADIIKLVASVTDISEIARIFQLLSHCQV